MKKKRPYTEPQIPMLNNKKKPLQKLKHPNSQIRKNVKNWKNKIQTDGKT